MYVKIFFSDSVSGDKQPTKLKKKESESKKDTDNSKDDGTFTKVGLSS